MVPKRVGRPPTGQGSQIQVRLQPDLLTGLDAFISSHPEPLSRPEAIRLALKEWLTSLGLLKHRDDPEGAN